MDPADTFALNLRGCMLRLGGRSVRARLTLYRAPTDQKQALKWMYSMENGESNARENLSMHPLWEEYRFPQAPNSRNDAEAFYYNPYSGQ